MHDASLIALEMIGREALWMPIVGVVCIKEPTAWLYALSIILSIYIIDISKSLRYKGWALQRSTRCLCPLEVAAFNFFVFSQSSVSPEKDLTELDTRRVSDFQWTAGILP